MEAQEEYKALVKDISDMTLHEKLIAIQRDLKAPKGQYNAFGKYRYRSCEDILEAAKPLLAREGCVLTIYDELVLIGTRYYVKATACLGDGENTIQITSYAREEETKKGMDGSQITGASSSYARKYALNGLLLIDDTKDADTQDNTENPKNKPKAVSENQTVQPPVPIPEVPGETNLAPSGGESDAPASLLNDMIYVDEVRKQDGTNKTTGKPWTKYIVVSSEGTGSKKYSTFDKKIAETAKGASGAGAQIRVEYHIDKFGNQIDDIRLCEYIGGSDGSISL